MTQNQLNILQECMHELKNVTEEEQGIYYHDIIVPFILMSDKINRVKFTKKIETALTQYILSVVTNKDVDYRIKNVLLSTFLKF